MEFYIADDYVDGNYHIVVTRPILTPEERERRMKRIHDAAVAVMREFYDAHEKNEKAIEEVQ